MAFFFKSLTGSREKVPQVAGSTSPFDASGRVDSALVSKLQVWAVETIKRTATHTRYGGLLRVACRSARFRHAGERLLGVLGTEMG